MSKRLKPIVKDTICASTINNRTIGFVLACLMPICMISYRIIPELHRKQARDKNPSIQKFGNSHNEQERIEQNSLLHEVRSEVL
jgi:hypothetical protein